MTCDICHKKQATVHLTEIINDKVTKLHLCENCAREKGEEMEGHFGLSDLLAGLADLGIQAEPKVASKTKCPSCGFTLHDFRKIGRLGCSKCYETFKEQLAPLLRQIHGSDRHIGKTPIFSVSKQKGRPKKKAAQEQDTLQGLRIKLEKAIHLEEFEKAAVIRDQIREMEKKIRKGKS
jgi:protein arginine kinase activator